jgi:hypothetical protein
MITVSVKVVKRSSSVKTASSRSIEGRDGESLSNRNEGASTAKAKQELDFQRLLLTKLQVFQLQWVK